MLVQSEMLPVKLKTVGYFRGNPIFELTEDYHWRGLIVPKGFKTDFDSVPRVPIVHSRYKGRSTKSAVIHDFLYHLVRQGRMERMLAERLYKLAMKDEGVPKNYRNVNYNTLVMVGWATIRFNKHWVNDIDSFKDTELPSPLEYKTFLEAPVSLSNETSDLSSTLVPEVPLKSVTEPPMKLQKSLLLACMPSVDYKVWKPILCEVLGQQKLKGERKIMFLAQIGHESNDCRNLEENLRYTSAKRLMKVWPRRFKTEEDAASYVNNPEALANLVYGDRMGNTEEGDGWKYRGRGLIQLTGKDNYLKASEAFGLDFIKNPDLLLDRSIAASVSAWWFNTHTTGVDITKVTRQINGGLNGLKDREHRYKNGLSVMGLI